MQFGLKYSQLAHQSHEVRLDFAKSDHSEHDAAAALYFQCNDVMNSSRKRLNKSDGSQRF